jgi:hypothetical protein
MLKEKISVKLNIPYIYLPEQKMFLCSTGVLFSLAEFKSGINVRTEYERKLKESELYDYDYAKAYISSYKNKKSVRVLEFDLELKGFDRNIIKELISELDVDDVELKNIEKFVQRHRDTEGNVPEEKRRKLMTALYRKGYKVDNIKKIIDDIY